LEVNKNVIGVANSFVKIAELAYENDIGLEELSFSYIANAAFAVELFLKSFTAESYEKVIFYVGEAELKREFSRVLIRSHDLELIYDRLPKQIKDHLESSYKSSVNNLNICTLKEQLSDLSQHFVKARYGFEENPVFVEEAEELRFLLRFFQEVISEM